ATVLRSCEVASLPIRAEKKNEPTRATVAMADSFRTAELRADTSLRELYGSDMAVILGTSEPNSRDSSRLFAHSNPAVQIHGSYRCYIHLSQPNGSGVLLLDRYIQAFPGWFTGDFASVCFNARREGDDKV